MYQIRNNELLVLSSYTRNYGAAFYVREAAKKACLPLKTAHTALTALEGNHILKSVIKGRHKYFALNLTNIQTRNLLILAELQTTIAFLERHPEFKMFVKALEANTTLAVFGSLAAGTPSDDSDADLLVIAEKERPLPAHLLSRRIHAIFMTPHAFAEALLLGEPLIKEIEGAHVLLANHALFVELLWRHHAPR